jgi:TatD DNase family protein
VIDTHAHLDALEDDAAAVLGRAREAGVTRVIAIGSGIDSCRAAVELAEREEGVFAALGIHPHQAGDDEAGRLDELRDLLSSPRAVAVGETGLDHYRDYAPRYRQRELFEAQLALASELDKPAVIHSRAADDATVAALESFAGTVVLHCFSSPGLLEPAVEHGWYVSFAGNVTYPNAYDLRTAARAVPAERLLVETDSPYLSPQPRRGRPNEPANVVHTVAALAEARGEEVGRLTEQIDANADAAFVLA